MNTIKTWQSRMQEVYGRNTRGFKPDEYMMAEIAELRAALTKQADAVPVGSMDSITYEPEDGTITARKDGVLLWHSHIYANHDSVNDVETAKQVATALTQRVVSETVPVVGYRMEMKPGDYSFMDAKHWSYSAFMYNGCRVHELILGRCIQDPGVDADVAAVFPSLWKNFAQSATPPAAGAAGGVADNNQIVKKPISKEWCERMAKAEIDANVNIEAGNAQSNKPVALSERATFERVTGYDHLKTRVKTNANVDKMLVLEEQWNGWKLRAELCAPVALSDAEILDISDKFYTSNRLFDVVSFTRAIEQRLAAATQPTDVERFLVEMPKDITKDDALWRAGCRAFRAALNEMTGRDGYVVQKVYDAIRKHIAASGKEAK